MIARGSCCAEPGDCRSLRSRSGDESHEVVVPVHHPRALHRPPAESLDSELERRAHRAGSRSQLKALCDLDAALCDWLPVDERDDLVNTAVVFRDGEARVERSGAVDGELAERDRRVLVLLAAEAVVVLDHPAAGDRSPREVNCLARGQSGGLRDDVGSNSRRLVGERQRL